MHAPQFLKISLLLLVLAATTVASPAQTITIGRSFIGTNGSNPYTPLVQGWNGNFYGGTLYGGPAFDASTESYAYGTIFELAPSGATIPVYNFCSVVSGTICADGDGASGLILGEDGNLYGTTYNGGNSTCGGVGCGTVFKLTPGGTLTTLHSFCAGTGGSCSDGELPNPIIQASTGVFYGTAYYGGTNNVGTVFSLTSSGTLTVLHSFDGKHGSYPVGALLQASNGDLYGTTYEGGSGTGVGGTVFVISPTGKFGVLYNFCSQTACTDGQSPTGALIQASDGNLYGTTDAAGLYNAGTIFKITLDGQFTSLYSFCPKPGCVDGEIPRAGLIQATDGNFYGTTALGGAHGFGNVFQYSLSGGTDANSGTVTTLYSFCSLTAACLDGSEPMEPPLQSTNGTFYGNTVSGGHFTGCSDPQGTGCGVLYSLSMGLGPFVTLNPAAAAEGRTVSILGNNLTGTTGVTFDGVSATFTVVSNTHIVATVPSGAASGPIQVITPAVTLSSNVAFQVLP